MIPVIKVTGENLPEVWELSLIKLWSGGVEMPTEYANSPLSLDCTMIQVIENPFSEPRYHKKLPTSFEGLEEYRKEVVEGLHNEYVGNGWNYSYNDRLTNYDGYAIVGYDKVTLLPYELDQPKSIPGGINQLDYIIKKLIAAPHSRRALAITWIPQLDEKDDECPCFQQANCRIDTNDLLHMTTYWRSRDAFKAAFMNMIAFTDLQRHIAEEVSKGLGREIKVGQYTDISNSYHLYDRYYVEFEKFYNSLKTRPFEARTMTSLKFNELLETTEKISKEKQSD